MVIKYQSNKFANAVDYHYLIIIYAVESFLTFFSSFKFIKLV